MVYFLNYNLSIVSRIILLGIVTLLILTIFYFLIDRLVIFEKWKKALFTILTIVLSLSLQSSTLKKGESLPQRSDPFPHTEFSKFLFENQRGGLYRHYSHGGYLIPNTAMTFPLSTMNTLTVLLNKPLLEYGKLLGMNEDSVVFRYGDLAGFPYYGGLSPLNQYFQYKKYWDNVGVRYLIGGEQQKVLVEHSINPPIALINMNPNTKGHLKIVELDVKNGNRKHSYKCTVANGLDGLTFSTHRFGRQNIATLTYQVNNITQKKKWNFQLNDKEIVDGQRQ